MKCLVEGCTNTTEGGSFVGHICSPCHALILEVESLRDSYKSFDLGVFNNIVANHRKLLEKNNAHLAMVNGKVVLCKVFGTGIYSAGRHEYLLKGLDGVYYNAEGAAYGKNFTITELGRKNV